MEEVKTTGIFEQKFDLWNKKLLDLSRRNRLLNYKVRKAGTYKPDGDIEELFDKLVNGNGFVLFLKIVVILKKMNLSEVEIGNLNIYENKLKKQKTSLGLI